MNQIYHWDCLEVMDKLIEKWIKVDAIITDPPYWTVKNIQLDWWTNKTTNRDTRIELKPLLEKCNKILKQNWVLILFSQEPYTSKLIQNSNTNISFNYRLVREKDHFANPFFAKKAPVSYFEDICVFTKNYDTEWKHPLRDYALKVKQFIWNYSRERFRKEFWNYWFSHFLECENTAVQFQLCTKKTYDQLIEHYGIDKMQWFKDYETLNYINKNFWWKKTFNLEPWKKHKSNILKYKKDYLNLHPTSKPVALMEDLVKTYTNEWELVLDFTAWSWTTGVACQNTGRNYILIEKEEKYFEIMKNRLLENQKVLEIQIF